MFWQVVVGNAQPMQALFIMYVELRCKCLRVLQLSRVDMDFTGIVIRLKCHRTAAGRAEMPGDAGAGGKRGPRAVPREVRQPKTDEGHDRSTALTPAIIAVAITSPCGRSCCCPFERATQTTSVHVVLPPHRCIDITSTLANGGRS